MTHDTEALRPPFRTGDLVRHEPTGEAWVVAWADPATGHMAWMGWPDGEAKISDCVLTRPTSDEAHQKWLAELIQAGGSRAARAVRLYGQPESAGRQALADRDAQDHG